MNNKCKSCGACDNHKVCSCCGSCRNCGQSMSPNIQPAAYFHYQPIVPTAVPFVPIVPAATWSDVSIDNGCSGTSTIFVGDFLGPVEGFPPVVG